MPPVMPAIRQIKVGDGTGETDTSSESSLKFPAMSQLLSKADVNGMASIFTATTKSAAEMLLGHGLPPLPRKTVEKMINWEYVEFCELPPAKVSGLKSPIHDCSILLVQSADFLSHQRRLIPNITVWVQCFCVYSGVMAMKHPGCIPDMLAYMKEIVQANNQYRWPSWVIYDSSFRKQAADTGNHDWSKVDPSLHLCSLPHWLGKEYLLVRDLRDTRSRHH